jgi:hypothetical protein
LTTYFLRRLLLVIPTFIGITMAVFVITHFVPGGPIERQIAAYRMSVGGEAGGMAGGIGASTEMPPDAIEELKRFYGFDKPVHVRYASWLWNVVRLDLGTSYVYQDPVWDVIKSRFPVSLTLGLTGFLLSYLICVPLGVLKAVRHGSRFDFISSFVVFLGYSIPGWALGTGLLVLLGGGSFWSVFPLGGFRPGDWEYLSAGGKIVGQAHHMFRRREDRGAGASYVPAGALLHGRVLRDPDDSGEELAAREPRAGLRAHGVRQGARRAPGDLRTRAAELAHPAGDRPWTRVQPDPRRVVPHRARVQHRRDGLPGRSIQTPLLL